MTVVVDASVVAETLLGTERGAKAAPLIRDLPTVAKILGQMRTNARNVRYEDLAKVCEHTLAHQGLEAVHMQCSRHLGPVTRESTSRMIMARRSPIRFDR